MTLIAVVFPEPLGPTSPRISPGATWKLSPSSAVKPTKRSTSFWTLRMGFCSGDMPASSRRERDQPRRKEQHQPHDQQAIDQLKVLRRGEADQVVDTVQDDHTDDRAGDGGHATEQREHDGEDRELSGEHVV